MYGDAPVKYEDIKGLQDCHPDKLRENLEAETKDAVTNAVRENRVDDINDLLTLQQQLQVLTSANEMIRSSVEAKDRQIAELEQTIAEMKKSYGAKGNASV